MDKGLLNTAAQRHIETHRNCGSMERACAASREMHRSLAGGVPEQREKADTTLIHNSEIISN